MFSFPKSCRILRRQDFKFVMEGGVKAVTPLFVVIGRHRPELAAARLGLVVSRKVGNSVVRNHVKRRIRENFRLYLGGYPLRRVSLRQ